MPPHDGDHRYRAAAQPLAMPGGPEVSRGTGSGSTPRCATAG
jgi:hypothetical protein